MHSGGGFSHLHELGADFLHGRQRSLDSAETPIARPSGGDCDRMMYDVGSCPIGGGQMNTKSVKSELLSHFPPACEQEGQSTRAHVLSEKSTWICA